VLFYDKWILFWFKVGLVFCSIYFKSSTKAPVIDIEAFTLDERSFTQDTGSYIIGIGVVAGLLGIRSAQLYAYIPR